MTLRQPAAPSIVTADHGNAEQMWDDELNGAAHRAHVEPRPGRPLRRRLQRGRRLHNGWLRDVAPTMLTCWGSRRRRDDRSVCWIEASREAGK